MRRLASGSPFSMRFASTTSSEAVSSLWRPTSARKSCRLSPAPVHGRRAARGPLRGSSSRGAPISRPIASSSCVSSATPRRRGRARAQAPRARRARRSRAPRRSRRGCGLQVSQELRARIRCQSVRTSPFVESARLDRGSTGLDVSNGLESCGVLAGLDGSNGLNVRSLRSIPWLCQGLRRIVNSAVNPTKSPGRPIPRPAVAVTSRLRFILPWVAGSPTPRRTRPATCRRRPARAPAWR